MNTEASLSTQHLGYEPYVTGISTGNLPTEGSPVGRPQLSGRAILTESLMVSLGHDVFALPVLQVGQVDQL